MFKSGKKLDDPPKPMTLQEIDEDLVSFKPTIIPVNRTQLNDIKQSVDDINNLDLHEFWQMLRINQHQMDDIEKLKEEIEMMKEQLKQEHFQITEQRGALLSEIKTNLKRIHELKTPK